MAEPQQLLLARIIIAQAVVAAGWEVTTEYRSAEASAGWTADVYAQRGGLNVGFQVQWTPLDMAEIRERQVELRADGIRGAWFYRLYRNRTYRNPDLLDEYETPLFGLRLTDDDLDFEVPRYGVRLHEFVTGMLKKELAWSPRPGDLMEAGIHVMRASCWKCQATIGIPVGVSLRTPEGFFYAFRHFHDPGIPGLIASSVDPSQMEEYRIGPIKLRFSRTMQGSYLSNGCVRCDAIQDEFYVEQMAHQLLSRPELPLPTFRRTVPLTRELSTRGATWRFQGDPGRDQY